MKIHPPSLLVGLAIAFSLACLLGAAVTQSTAPNRYDLKANDSHVFVIDRQTGTVWQRYISNTVQSDPDFAQPKTR